MSGYRYLVEDDGTLKLSALSVYSYLDGEGDLEDVLSQCYGMIWYLAAQLAIQVKIQQQLAVNPYVKPRPPSRDDILLFIEKARLSQEDGYKIGMRLDISPEPVKEQESND